ncbi:aspartate aminotransferase family protein [Paenibacillus sp. MWE-103]|uniref:Aspartate aminotransferase family protein n=1 Tax=Paenibacillus artemisiicola TaxID=1172618 RepID=A0ABS3WG51_9BACL|nr:aspartate aminotransferase family protein [Paenibacillus artemisiicola]MBO7747306.1 aspartate aminotransferase family protein [Paenibacillus artemisiicola]
MTYSREQGDINASDARGRYWERNLSPAARAVFEADHRYFLHQSLSTPVLNVLSRAEGIHIYDMDGKAYIDMHGNGVHNAGFNNDAVIEAVVAALREKNTFAPRRYTNAHAVALAKKLVEITPEGLDRVLFAPGGSEAIEMAVMLAKQVTGKWKTISFWDSYHGNGFQAASVGGERLFKTGSGPMVPGALHVEFPNYYRNPWGFATEEQVDDEILRQMELLFEREGDIACVVGEPISSTPVVPSGRFWARVKAMCEKYGALLIFDEIIEGFGRTGRMFACEHSVTPDVLVLGKSLGGGLLPFAGIVTREAYNTLPHVSIGHYTHEKNGLCAAAGLAMIAYVEKHGLVRQAERVGAFALDWLEGMRARCPLVGHVGGKGLHIGIELVKDGDAKEKAVAEAEAVMYKAMERGVAFKIIEGNVITLRPSLLITEDEMRGALEIIEQCIREVAHGRGYE